MSINMFEQFRIVLNPKARQPFGLLLLLTFLLLSGCGGTTSAQQPQQPPKDANAQPAQTSAKYPMKIKHILGETVIDHMPERTAVVWGEYYMGGNLVSLGVIPSVITTTESWFKNEKGLPTYLIDPLKNTKLLARTNPVNFEQLLQANPDLIIIANSPLFTAQYEQLSKIAPTVVIGNYSEFESVHRELAGIFGKEELAERQIAESNQVAAQAKNKLAKTVGQEKVAIVEANGKSLWIHDDSPIANLIYKELGLTPAYPIVSNGKAESSSIEGLAAIEPDRMILYWTTKESMAELEKNEVWSRLKAVKNGKVYRSDNSIQWTASFPIGRQYTIDEITSMLSK